MSTIESLDKARLEREIEIIKADALRAKNFLNNQQYESADYMLDKIIGIKKPEAASNKYNSNDYDDPA